MSFNRSNSHELEAFRAAHKAFLEFCEDIRLLSVLDSSHIFKEYYDSDIFYSHLFIDTFLTIFIHIQYFTTCAPACT